MENLKLIILFVAILIFLFLFIYLARQEAKELKKNPKKIKMSESERIKGVLES